MPLNLRARSVNTSYLREGMDESKRIEHLASEGALDKGDSTLNKQRQFNSKKKTMYIFNLKEYNFVSAAMQKKKPF